MEDVKEVRVYLGLGSNLGDRMDNLLQGLRILGSRISLTRVSSIYESEPGVIRTNRRFSTACARVSLPKRLSRS